MKKTSLYTIILLGCVACATQPAYQVPEIIDTPKTWLNETATNSIQSAWLTDLDDGYLTSLITEALNHNPQYLAQTTLIDHAEQQLIISGAPRLPTISASVSSNRVNASSLGSAVTSSSFSATLSLGWEIDVWGKLSATKKQASLNLAAQQAQLDRIRQSLVADICNTWYDLIEAQTLLTLYQQRLKNLSGNLDIIESSYQQGISTALDVYLARNGMQQEAARTATQQLALIDSQQRLQLLLGRYPDGQNFPIQSLPVLASTVAAGIPSELIDRRPDLRSAWLTLMAADAAVAIAHKQRFPSLTLTGNIGQSSTEMQNLFSSNNNTWSIASSLLQPLFNAGTLAAQEQQARIQVRQLEQEYQASVLGAFFEVESALARETNLSNQLDQYIEAEKSALAAEHLSFEQYQRGLVAYTTVLESQRRAFDSQSTVIQLRRQQLQNRVALYLALGGDYEIKADQ